MSYKRENVKACVLLVWASTQWNFVALWPTFVVMSRYFQVIVRFDWFAPLRRPGGLRSLPLPRIFMIMGGMNAPFRLFHSWYLGVRYLDCTDVPLVIR